MSELFDSLNLSTSAGPSSSQQSSSQPSTSKVFWHASPSPGVLRQLANWTPNKSQDSPTLPLCTQAFVGELKKLPGAYEAQSPLIARDSAKRKRLMDSSRGTARHVSDPTANRVKTRERIELELSDDEEEDEGDAGGGHGPRRLLLGDAGESSPESARRRTLDAGNTGRMRQPSSPSQNSSATARTTLSQFDKDLPQQPLSHRRLDRRPPRRRKKESLIAGLGFTDDSGRATDCLKLFEDLQAAIQGMQSASRPSTSGSAEDVVASLDQLPIVTAEGGGGASVGGSGRLAAREGLNRTTSAPSTSSAVQSLQHEGTRSSQHRNDSANATRDDPSTPRRAFRPVKSDHDVFKPAGQLGSMQTRALQPRPINVPSEPRPQVRPRSQQQPIKALSEQSKPAAISQHSQSKALQAPDFEPSQPLQVAPVEAPKRSASPPIEPADVGAQARSIRTAGSVAHAQPSPVKRSARIEAMQQTTHNNGASKKLGVRGPSMLSKSVSPSNKPAAAAAPARKSGPGTTPGRTRTLPVKMSQARQVGLPRSCSQSIPASQHSVAVGGVGPAAPFRPPAIAVRATAGREVRSSSPVKRVSKAGPASSDDSFGDVDDDAAFLALACEFEY